MTAINTWVGIQLVAGDSTRPQDVQYNGAIVLAPPDELSTVGTGPNNVGYLAGIPGYLQVGGPTGHQWIMSTWMTSAVISQFNAIPPNGWVVAASSNTYASIGTTLVETYKATPPDVLGALKSLYDAAVANNQG